MNEAQDNMRAGQYVNLHLHCILVSSGQTTVSSGSQLCLVDSSDLGTTGHTVQWCPVDKPNVLWCVPAPQTSAQHQVLERSQSLLKGTLAVIFQFSDIYLRFLRRSHSSTVACCSLCCCSRCTAQDVFPATQDSSHRRPPKRFAVQAFQYIALENAEFAQQLVAAWALPQHWLAAHDAVRDVAHRHKWTERTLTCEQLKGDHAEGPNIHGSVSDVRTLPCLVRCHDLRRSIG
jgi:hypothetical protein